MRSININPSDLSHIFWKKILDHSFLKQNTIIDNFFLKIDGLDNLRKNSDYNTGSITSTTAWLLYALTFYFQPKLILEVGSFIGKSTFSMALAAENYDENGDVEIHCCDHSNEIIFPQISKTKIFQYHKTSSTDMMKIIDRDKIFNFIHLDGRLQNNDYDLMMSRLDENSIFIFDDFEGGEKGVANFLNLLTNKIVSWNSYCLVYPINYRISQKYKLIEPSNTAILLPIKYLKVSRQ